MNRQKLLKTILMGEKFEPVAEDEQAWLRWATVHASLLSPSLFSLSGRLINHYMIGSDPEFALNSNGHIVGAYPAGLYVGLAAGCDQNERLVELRPWPSKSVVEHVAGILTALRWLYRVGGDDIRLPSWRAGAFFDGDGLGGHVHFGRKRPTRTEEVAALDGLANNLECTGLFPIVEWKRRRAGDALHQVYGALGDFRVQKHGYEYRSLPSWLQSPTTAFISLACSKLAVLDPEITTTWKTTNFDDARFKLRGLAKLFKSRDDDAYILYHLLTVQGDNVFDVVHTADFMPAWGILRSEAQVPEERTYILPACIEPNPEEVNEIQQHLVLGVPLTFKRYPPKFTTSVPEEYRWVPRNVHPGRRSGFGDFIHDLVQHRSANIVWDHRNNANWVINGFIPSTWSGVEVQALKQFSPKVQIVPTFEGSETAITIPKDLTQTGTITGLKTMLLYTGMFPLWTVETVKPNSFYEWLQKHGQRKPKKGWRQL